MASFNPCFNGFMDKEVKQQCIANGTEYGFNPCFNGFMDKECRPAGSPGRPYRFNPCFNGFMDKEQDKKKRTLQDSKFQSLF